MVQMIKNLPSMRETQIRSLGWEDFLEKGMVTYSYILVWRTPWTEKPGSLVSGDEKSHTQLNESLSTQKVNIGH